MTPTVLSVTRTNKLIFKRVAKKNKIAIRCSALLLGVNYYDRRIEIIDAKQKQLVVTPTPLVLAFYLVISVDSKLIQAMRSNKVFTAQIG